MPRRHSVVCILAAFIAIAWPSAASAQTTTMGFAGTAIAIAKFATPRLALRPSARQSLATVQPVREIDREWAVQKDRGIQWLSYGLIATQALDVHSTYLALHNGKCEGNSFMRPLTRNFPAYVAVKSAMTFIIFREAQSAAKRNNRKMFWVLVVADATMGALAINNYRMAAQ